jgi:hypothetical protein
MSGHHKFRELTKDFGPERQRRIKAESAELREKMDREIHIEPVVLDWSAWHSWEDIRKDVRDGGIRVPYESGVYEARLQNEDERLTIGRASHLYSRVKDGLVKGNSHSTSWRIQDNESVEDILIRWAITNRPAAVEEELHKRYKGRFGKLPKYTKNT